MQFHDKIDGNYHGVSNVASDWLAALLAANQKAVWKIDSHHRFYHGIALVSQTLRWSPSCDSMWPTQIYLAVDDSWCTCVTTTASKSTHWGSLKSVWSVWDRLWVSRPHTNSDQFETDSPISGQISHQIQTDQTDCKLTQDRRWPIKLVNCSRCGIVKI